jgi:hypothetical protein
MAITGTTTINLAEGRSSPPLTPEGAAGAIGLAESVESAMSRRLHLLFAALKTS